MLRCELSDGLVSGVFFFIMVLGMHIPFTSIASVVLSTSLAEFYQKGLTGLGLFLVFGRF